METENQTFIEWLEELVKPIREWIIENHQNPFLWFGIVLLVLAVFGITYNTLHKD